jgi:hypothetical protein
MENLNPKYFLFQHDQIHQALQAMDHNDPTRILQLCPILTIPVGTLIYHSNKFTRAEMLEQIRQLNINRGRYSANKGCEICNINQPIPTENVGTIPRITELAYNPNVREGRCKCLYGRQSRLYGNFNFIGNYDIAIQNQMKGTQAFIVTQEMRLIDMTFINVELGLSPKRYKVQGIIISLDLEKHVYIVHTVRLIN